MRNFQLPFTVGVLGRLPRQPGHVRMSTRRPVREDRHAPSDASHAMTESSLYVGVLQGCIVLFKVSGRMAMIESRITAKGQTTLPKPVREALGVGTGDRVRYVIADGEVRILAVRPVGRLFGALRRDGPPVTLEQMEKAVADGVAQE